MASTRPLGQTRAQQSQSKTLPTVLKVTHEQLVHQKQSLEVVQTLLLASVCGSFFYRP